jgi:ParB-like chromosome segregation protein Spo0J
MQTSEKWWYSQVHALKKLSMEERREIAVLIDPFLVINVDPYRHQSGAKRKKFEALLHSIQENGIICPVILCPTILDPDIYSVLFGGHRVLACRILGIKVLSNIIRQEQGR